MYHSNYSLTSVNSAQHTPPSYPLPLDDSQALGFSTHPPLPRSTSQLKSLSRLFFHTYLDDGDTATLLLTRDGTSLPEIETRARWREATTQGTTSECPYACSIIHMDRESMRAHGYKKIGLKRAPPPETQIRTQVDAKIDTMRSAYPASTHPEDCADFMHDCVCGTPSISLRSCCSLCCSCYFN